MYRYHIFSFFRTENYTDIIENFEGKWLKINTSFYNFQVETVIMLTSAKNTGCSEVLIFILELLSEVKSHCHCH